MPQRRESELWSEREKRLLVDDPLDDPATAKGAPGIGESEPLLHQRFNAAAREFEAVSG